MIPRLMSKSASTSHGLVFVGGLARSLGVFYLSYVYTNVSHETVYPPAAA